MAAIARTAASAARVARVAPVARGARQMSGGGSPAEVFEHKEMWFKTTIAAVAAIVIPYTAFTMYKEGQHEHHEKKIAPHMHHRVKAFPWQDKDCALFDLHCGKEEHGHH